jgi:hypothetical protein
MAIPPNSDNTLRLTGALGAVAPRYAIVRLRLAPYGFDAC